MIVTWSKSKNGYLLYSASNSKIPTYINGFPIVGLFCHSFNIEEYTPIHKIFTSFFERKLKNVGSDYKYKGDTLINYEWYECKMLKNRLIIKSKTTSECYYQETYITEIETSVEFDNKLLYEVNVEFSEEDHLHDDIKYVSFCLSKNISHLIQFITEIYGLNNILQEELNELFKKDNNKKALEEYTSFLESTSYRNYSDIEFYLIKYCSRYFKRFYLDVNNISKPNDENNLIIDKKDECSSETIKLDKTLTISNIYHEKNEFGLEFKYINIGKYPQVKLKGYENGKSNDSALIRKLDDINDVNEKGYKTLDGIEYLFKKTGDYSWEKTYYRVEPLKFRVLKEYEDNLLIMSENIIDMYDDASQYYERFSENRFLSELFLSNETNKIIKDSIDYMVNQDKIDYGINGKNISEEKITLLNKIYKIIKKKYDEDYSGGAVGSEFFFHDIQKNIGLSYFFKYISPITKELQKIFSINEKELKSQDSSFFGILSYQDLQDENMGFEKGIMGKVCTRFEYVSATRKALCTDYAKSNGGSLKYNFDFTNYSFVDGQLGSISKNYRSFYGSDKQQQAFRPIFLIKKENINKVLQLKKDENAWKEFIKDSHQQNFNQEFNNIEKENKKCPVCGKSLELDNWCSECEYFVKKCPRCRGLLTDDDFCYNCLDSFSDDNYNDDSDDNYDDYDDDDYDDFSNDYEGSESDYNERDGYDDKWGYYNIHGEFPDWDDED